MTHRDGFSWFAPTRARTRKSGERENASQPVIRHFDLSVTDQETEAALPDHQLSEREIIAHHEAAHAILAIDLDLGLLDVGIDLARVDATGGVGNVGCRLFVADMTGIEPSEIESAQRRLAGQIDCTGTVLAAGAASDARLRDEDPWSALGKQQSDFRHMRDLLRQAQLDETAEIEEHRLRSQLDLAVEALNDPLVWKAVEAIAQKVIERGELKGPEIEAMAKPILDGEPGQPLI